MTTQTVMVTGATGFIGSAVVRALAGRDGSELTSSVGRNVADLLQPDSLARICEGVDTLVHCAGYVGPDAELCDRVNRHGTRVLVEEARRAGVGRIVGLSTAAVYGDGPHRAMSEDAITPAPASALSASRLAAEQYVREAGGCVVRPFLVYGRGDRWVVPTLARLFGTLPAWVAGGTAVASMIEVDALGRAMAKLATDPVSWPDGGVLHAAHPTPVAIRDMGAAMAAVLGIRIPGPATSVSPADAMEYLRRTGARGRHLSMLSHDHWYDSSRFWTATGVGHGPAFPEGLAASADWYQEELTKR